MTKKNKMKSCDDATVVKKQITEPCEDCPFARTAIPGWLGSSTPAEYCFAAHQDDLIECHTKIVKDKSYPIQCAGASIYRANVSKRCYLPIIALPKDKEKVFATPIEFLEHHLGRKVTSKEISKMFSEVIQARLEMEDE